MSEERIGKRKRGGVKEESTPSFIEETSQDGGVLKPSIVEGDKRDLPQFEQKAEAVNASAPKFQNTFEVPDYGGTLDTAVVESNKVKATPTFEVRATTSNTPKFDASHARTVNPARVVAPVNSIRMPDARPLNEAKIATRGTQQPSAPIIEKESSEGIESALEGEERRTREDRIAERQARWDERQEEREQRKADRKSEREEGKGSADEEIIAQAIQEVTEEVEKETPQEETKEKTDGADDGQGEGVKTPPTGSSREKQTPPTNPSGEKSVEELIQEEEKSINDILKDLEEEKKKAKENDKDAQRKSNSIKAITGISDGLASLANLIGVSKDASNVTLNDNLTPLVQRLETARQERKADIKEINDKIEQKVKELRETKLQGAKLKEETRRWNEEFQFRKEEAQKTEERWSKEFDEEVRRWNENFTYTKTKDAAELAERIRSNKAAERNARNLYNLQVEEWNAKKEENEYPIHLPDGVVKINKNMLNDANIGSLFESLPEELKALAVPEKVYANSIPVGEKPLSLEQKMSVIAIAARADKRVADELRSWANNPHNEFR